MNSVCQIPTAVLSPACDASVVSPDGRDMQRISPNRAVGLAFLIALTCGGNSLPLLMAAPSSKRKTFHPECKATIGVVAGGGRTTKPLLKAGARFHLQKTKAKNWPKVTCSGMNACSHPFGGGRKKFAGRPTTTSRNAPPGRKVGLIAARRTGRKTR